MAYDYEFVHHTWKSHHSTLWTAELVHLIGHCSSQGGRFRKQPADIHASSITGSVESDHTALTDAFRHFPTDQLHHQSRRAGIQPMPQQLAAATPASWTGTWYTRRCITPQYDNSLDLCYGCWLATCQAQKLEYVTRWRVRCAGTAALSCWKTNTSPAMLLQITGSSSCISKTSR